MECGVASFLVVTVLQIRAVPFAIENVIKSMQIMLF